MVSPVRLSASSELFEIETGATFDVTVSGSTNGQFNWTIKEEHLRDLPYQVVIKAVDSKGATTFKVIRIKVNSFSTNTAATFKDLGYQLFPNPTSNHFYIQIPDNQINKPITVSIFDNLGRLVQQSHFEQAEKNIRLKTASFSSGNYLVNMQMRGVVISSMVVIDN